MRLDNLDRILSAEEEILPSSGFVSSVMDVVLREAASPPPIPFPWKRALPGLVVAGLTITFALVAGFIQLIGGVRPLPLPQRPALEFAPTFEAAKGVGVDWILLALLLTLASVKFSMRLAGARS